MSLRLYDTLTRVHHDFEPLQPGKVTMYVCGATVQSPPHIGHIRFAVSFDVLRRWLLHLGYEVTYLRNVTDIEDKVIAKSAEQDIPWWQLAYANEQAFSAAFDATGCLRPTLEPRATGHVPEMIELMRRLIDAGHAYASGGDVLFDVGSFPAYGELSGQKPDEMEPAGDTENAGAKQNPCDFALWKGAKPGEPTWDTPWGPGRPGWHLECSAMATKYLGREFDIHGGGIDLRFPHHENERAQSVAAGDGFARYWLHNAWVTTGGTKMSKSGGNSLLVSDVIQRARPVELRYYLATPHYRSSIEYGEDSLSEAAAAYRRLESFVERATEVIGQTPAPGIGTPVPEEFTAAMNDDLGVPQAMAVVYGAVRDGNSALAAGDKETVRERLVEVRAMLAVLGLDPLDPWWRSGGDEAPLRSVIDGLVAALLEQRAQARARKDFQTADAIRDQLRAAGVEVTDTPDGARWSVTSTVRGSTTERGTSEESNATMSTVRGSTTERGTSEESNATMGTVRGSTTERGTSEESNATMGTTTSKEPHAG